MFYVVMHLANLKHRLVTLWAFMNQNELNTVSDEMPLRRVISRILVHLAFKDLL